MKTLRDWRFPGTLLGAWVFVAAHVLLSLADAQARAQAMTEHHAPPVVTTAVKPCRC